jgi:hypothetical protein
MLDCADVNSGPPVPRRKRGSKLVQPEVVRIEASRSLGLHPLVGKSRGSLHWILLSTSSPAGRDGDLTFLVSLRCSVAIRLAGDANCSSGAIDIGPVRVQHFVLAFAGHQEEFKLCALVIVTRFEKGIQLLLLVNLGLPGPIILRNQPTNAAA